MTETVLYVLYEYMYSHRVDTRQSARLFLQSPELGPPTPSPVCECGCGVSALSIK
jgi:hypothetical protein